MKTATNTAPAVDLLALFAEVTAEMNAARIAADAKEDADLAAYSAARRAASAAFHRNLRREAGGK